MCTLVPCRQFSHFDCHRRLSKPLRYNLRAYLQNKADFVQVSCLYGFLSILQGRSAYYYIYQSVYSLIKKDQHHKTAYKDNFQSIYLYSFKPVYIFSSIIESNMNDEYNLEIKDPRIYHSLIKRVGVQGNYQKNFIRIIYLIGMVSASTFFIVTYLFYQNGYVCNDYQGDCNELVCSLPQSERAQYLSFPVVKSLANFYGDMHCQKMGDITNMQQAFLVGTTIGLVLILFFIEYLGRKLAIAISLILTIISLLLIIVVDSIVVKEIGLFIWGSGSQISFSILMTFVTQKTAQHDRMGYYVWNQVFFCIGAFLNWGLFYVFRDWQLVLGCYFVVFYVVAVVLFIYYVQSPPLDLISRYSTQDAYDAFMRIAERNQVTDHGLTFEQIQAIQQQYQQNLKKKHNYTINILDLLRYSSVRSDFLKLSLAFFVIAFLQYGPAFLLDELKMDFFTLAIINVAAQFFCLPFLRELMLNHPRSRTQTIIMIISTIFCFVTFGLAPTDCFNCNDSWKFVITLIAFFIIRIVGNLASLFFSSTLQQTFPAQIRSLGIYGVIAIGRIATIIIPYQQKLKQTYGVSLMLQYGVVSLVGIAIMAIIRQTWKVLPSEFIEELAIEHPEYKGKKK